MALRASFAEMSGKLMRTQFQIRNGAIFSLLLVLRFGGLALAQSPSKQAPPKAFMEATQAFARMDEEKARETEAYTLGVQSVLWGLQWVKAGESFRMFTAPLPAGTQRSPYDSNPHGIDIWGHAQKLLTAEFRTIETPNTETLYSSAIVDLIRRVLCEQSGQSLRHREHGGEASP
ncbi:MAG TPA: DUF1254 domain-containing protein [Bryobacteraceae bacterium]|jgi:hypothetical protein